MAPVLRGVIVPVAVPLSENYDLDEAGFSRLLEFLLDARVHGVFLNGSMGAFALHTDSLQLRVIEAAVDLVGGRVPVLAGVSDSGTARVRERIRALRRVDVDCLVALPPYFYQLDQDQLLHFYLDIAGFSDKPVLIYDNPRLARNSLTAETILRLSSHGNICGIKLSSTDVLQWQELLASGLDRSRFALLCGAGRLTALALRLGFDGITEGLHNVVPDIAVDLFQAAQAGDHARAAFLQQKINRCFRIFEIDGGWRGLEVAFQYMGICRKVTAHPYDLEIAAGKREEILEVLQAEGVLRPFLEEAAEQIQSIERGGLR